MNLRSFILAAWLGWTALLGGCSEGEDVSADATVRTLDAAIPRLMESANIPGLAIAVVADGKLVWTEGYGVTSIDEPRPVTARTVFEAASLSKPVFALAFLKLADEGEFDLDAPISRHFTDERLSHDERYARITPRLILSHRTGLPNWGRGEFTFARDPGARYGYSGEGFVLLQNAVTRELNRGLDAIVSDLLFEPAGMKDSGFVWEPGFEGAAADGHDEEGDGTPMRRYGTEGQDGANAAFSLLTNAGDYGRFLAYLMQGGGLTEATYGEMLTPQTRMTGEETRTTHTDEIWSKIAWGLSWGIQEVRGDTIYWHWGDNHIYRSFVAFDPGRRIGFVYFTNSQNGLKIAGELAAMVVGDMHWTLTWLGYGEGG